MPIYEYRCSVCGYQNDYLQKISEPPLTECPECGKSTFTKQVTAAGFQLKGTGWYVTDFRNNGTASAGAKKDGKGEPAGSGKGDAAAGSGKSEGAAASGATEGASSSTGAAASGAGTSSTST